MIYLLECDLANDPYVAKNFKDPNALHGNKHFTFPRHDFNKNAKFILIEMPTNTDQVTIETLKEIFG